MGSVVRGRRTITLKQKLKAVRIIATGTQFQGDTPPAITLKAMPQQFEAVSYSWTRLRDNKVLSTAQQITVKNGEVDVVETYRVEVKDRLDDVYIDTLSITKVTDGKPGDVGKRGQVIVQREWKEGDIYRNNDDVIDYVYHRATDSWWRLREGYDNIKAGLNPSNQFVQLTSLEHLAVNNFVAENANIAGFIFKDKVLKSQLPNLTNPNLILDGVNGKIIANDAKIKGHIEATSGKFTGEINATSGNIKDVKAINLTVTDLNATNGSIKNITGDNITINSGTFKGKVIFEDGTSAQDAIDKKVKEGVDSIQVGGRNLVLKSNIPRDNTNYNIADYDLSKPLVPGKTYVATIEGLLGKDKLSFQLYNSNTMNAQVSLYEVSEGVYRGVWQYRDVPGDFSKIRVFTSPNSISIRSKIDTIKIEEGNKNTPWTPAPEDLEAQIDDIQIGARNFIQTKYRDIQIRDSRYVSIPFTETLKGIYTIAATRKVVNKGGKGNSTYSLLSFRLKGIDSSITHSPVPVLLGEGESKFTINTGAQEIDKVYIYSGIDWLGSETIHTDLIDLRIGKGNKVSDWTESLEDINARIKDQEMYTEYSVNGTSAWHTPATSADRFMRQKKGNGAWSVALPFGKDGVNGKDGINGKNGVNGKDGKDGDRGPQGVAGQNGEPLGDGVMLFTDPDFRDGLNSARQYVGAIPTRVTKSSDAPTTSKYMLRMSNNGSNSESNGDRKAGFTQTVPSRANAVFIHKIIAKFPVGHSIRHYNNAVGANGKFTWLTSQEGTGRFQTYMYKLECGSNGEFHASGFGYVGFRGPAGTVAAPINYDIAYSTIFDMSIPDRSLDFLKTTVVGNSIATGTLLVGQNGNATAGITGFRASGASSNVSFWAGLSYENREKAPFQVWTDGKLVAQNADIKGKITATSGEFTGKVIATSGSFTGTVNANAGTFNNVTANNLTVNSGIFKGRLEANEGFFGSFEVGLYGIRNRIEMDIDQIDYGYIIYMLDFKSSIGYKLGMFTKVDGVSRFHNSNAQFINKNGTDNINGRIGVAIDTRGSSVNNHAIHISSGDISGLALDTVFKTNQGSYDIQNESVYINKVTRREIFAVGLPAGEYRWHGRTVTIVMAGNAYWDVYPGSAALYLHEGHYCGANQKLHFGSYATRMTITYNSSDNCWYITSINEY